MVSREDIHYTRKKCGFSYKARRAMQNETKKWKSPVGLGAIADIFQNSEDYTLHPQIGPKQGHPFSPLLFNTGFVILAGSVKEKNASGPGWRHHVFFIRKLHPWFILKISRIAIYFSKVSNIKELILPSRYSSRLYDNCISYFLFFPLYTS